MRECEAIIELKQMWRRSIAIALQPWGVLSSRRSSSVSSVVNSMLLRSLKEHYQEVSKMSPPPVCTILSLKKNLNVLYFVSNFVENLLVCKEPDLIFAVRNVCVLMLGQIG